MRETLDILRKQHQALADHEAARERKRGSRSPAERERLRTILAAHQQAWIAAGGADAEFLLAPLLALSSVEGLSDTPVIKPPPEERPRRRERA